MSDKPVIISNRMKAECIGEFSMNIEKSCSACYYGEPQPECEVCAGEIDYIDTHMIPWDTMKDIYKKMFNIYLEEQK